MTSRAARTALTLTVLVLVVLIGAVLGWKMLTQPLPSAPSAEPEGPCTEETVSRGKVIRPGMVTVSVYNAGTRGGLADDTLTRFARAGFGSGDTGNMPDGTKVRRAQVWVASKSDPQGRLVASYLGPKVPVLRKDDLPGPGVNVVVGNNFPDRLLQGKKKVTAHTDVTICRPQPAPVE